ncbi:GspE/PulE family protein [Oceanobacillus indicireducens]|uniref:Type II secretion system protein E n=1 Tax=Oceanobacillus indicireducens TaxID=1004261 RepID=A0A917XRT5_9BACI|nr:ATPase, T2SS/T4P/T4SS family [Oceanobacillus indicireducens]GGN48855.1 type II secretion system protein E [Oceanobacillus indicireducens]
MIRKRLGDLLVESALITEEQLATTLKSKNEDEKLGDALLREGFITEQQLIEVLEFQLGIPHINILQYPVDQEVIQLIPRDLAKRYQVLPFRKDGNKLFVAMSDPLDYFAIEEMRMATGLQIMPGIATKDALFRMITKHYDLQESIEQVLDDFSPEEDIEDAGITDEDAPIVRMVNQIIANAVAQRASDIHFDPQEAEVTVRYRVDGMLKTERSLPKYMQNTLIARIKIMGNLNITESRLPQDGRIKMHVNYKPIDIRISSLPSVYGEKIVMRILDISSSLGQLEKIGFSSANLATFTSMIEKPNGIVLVTGPTGSGKSSTLYAALNHLNQEEVNIITIEDPVEYQLQGINQVQVKEEVGMTFASGLRSILRQDPDIIMIGEIRDQETAEIAIRASLTGHLVLSTLHTNSATAALTRLIDMGIEPFLISSSLTGVVAQRLVRKVCRDCAKSQAPSSREIEIMRKANIEIETIQRGTGCSSCGMTGYRGRLAIHEVLPIDDYIKELIMKASSFMEIQHYVQESGMRFLLEDGLANVAQGLTTTEEVFRVASLN